MPCTRSPTHLGPSKFQTSKELAHAEPPLLGGLELLNLPPSPLPPRSPRVWVPGLGQRPAPSRAQEVVWAPPRAGCPGPGRPAKGALGEGEAGKRLAPGRVLLGPTGFKHPFCACAFSSFFGGGNRLAGISKATVCRTLPDPMIPAHVLRVFRALSLEKGRVVIRKWGGKSEKLSQNDSP